MHPDVVNREFLRFASTVEIYGEFLFRQQLGDLQGGDEQLATAGNEGTPLPETFPGR